MKKELDIKNEIERIETIIENIENENEKITGLTWLKDVNYKLINSYKTEIKILGWVLEE